MRSKVHRRHRNPRMLEPMRQLADGRDRCHRVVSPEHEQRARAVGTDVAKRQHLRVALGYLARGPADEPVAAAAVRHELEPQPGGVGTEQPHQSS